MGLITTDKPPATRVKCYCDGKLKGTKKDEHIRVQMIWRYPYWHCDVCGRKVYDGKFTTWRKLDAQRMRLEAKIAQLEDHLHNLRQLTSPYRSPVITDIPGTPLISLVSDSTGEFVARQDERIQDTEMELADTRAGLSEVLLQLSEIEQTVNELEERYRKVVEMTYRDGSRYESVCSVLHISTARYYQMRDTAIDVVDRI